VTNELESAIRAVRAAIRVISDRTDGEHVVSKDRFDISTGTDLRSQTVIQEILARTHPQHEFVGEEAGLDALPTKGTYWLVDPLCGTRNFTSRLPLYCVNVALIEDDRVVVGVLGDATLGQIYSAELGQGAWLETDGGRRPISVTDKAAIVVLDPGRPGVAAAEKAATVIAAAIRAGRWELRVLGTSLDLAYLADGRLAAVWHFSRIPALHFAAGTLLASEAGGVVTDDRGGPWTLDSRSLIAAATRDLHDSLRALEESR
jgi:myo-inositol-1(or 4)-monophosphatase